MENAALIAINIDLRGLLTSRGTTTTDRADVHEHTRRDRVGRIRERSRQLSFQMRPGVTRAVTHPRFQPVPL